MSKIYSSVVVCGSVAYDEIMNFPGKFVDHFHAEKLHQINISFAVNRLEKQFGGTATNIAYNLSLVSDSKIKILSAVGKDGADILEFLKNHKIDVSGILIDKKLYTSTGKVITDKKDNQIWGFYYGAAELGGKINLEDNSSKNSLIVLSANHEKAFINLQKQAIKLRVDYLYDPGMALTFISNKNLLDGVFSSKWLVGNDYEIAMIIKRLNLTINQLVESEIKVITTLGENGVRYKDKDMEVEIQSFRVKKTTDPTGAGDAWRAGFIAGIIDGKTTVDSLKLGNVLASFAVEKYGTVNHKPTKDEIEKRVKSVKSV